jgi:hypothetical protein
VGLRASYLLVLGFNRLTPTQDEPKHKDVEYHVVPVIFGICETDR